MKSSRQPWAGSPEPAAIRRRWIGRQIVLAADIVERRKCLSQAVECACHGLKTEI